jgi:hypothetical protein
MEVSMLPGYDIFRKDKGGQLLWCADAMTLNDAKGKIQKLTKAESAEFIIFNQATQERITVKPESAPWENHASG